MKSEYSVLIIGAGNIASKYDDISSKNIITHAHAVKNNSLLSLVGFYDSDHSNALAAATKWNTRALETLEGIKDQVDIICCATPDSTHYDVLMKAISLNPKLIVVEKPLVNSTHQLSLLKRNLYRNDIPIIVNYSRRFIYEFRELKARIRNNEFGKLLCGNAYYGKGLIHNASHMINLFLLLFNKIEIDDVREGIVDYCEDDRSFLLSLKVDDACITLTPVNCNMVTVFEMDLLFERCRIQYTDSDRTIKEYHTVGSQFYRDDIVYELVDTHVIDYNNAMVCLYDHVVDVINMNVPIESSIKDSFDTLDICFLKKGC